MSRSISAVCILFILSLLAFGCSNEKAIEETLEDWEDAINEDDADALWDTVSPDSNFYDTQTSQQLLDYFDGFTPVKYSDEDIDIDKPYADVLADATYAGVPVTGDDGSVMFVMKKEEGFFSFLNPDWRVYKYYDNGEFDDPVWQKLQRMTK